MSSLIIFAPHPPRPGHLREVVSEMRRRGPPRLYAYWRKRDAAWYALEGSHRTAAAKKLGLVPILERVYLKSEINHDTKDIWPDRRVSSILSFYDGLKWWVRYEFSLA